MLLHSVAGLSHYCAVCLVLHFVTTCETPIALYFLYSSDQAYAYTAMYYLKNRVAIIYMFVCIS